MKCNMYTKWNGEAFVIMTDENKIQGDLSKQILTDVREA